MSGRSLARTLLLYLRSMTFLSQRMTTTMTNRTWKKYRKETALNSDMVILIASPTSLSAEGPRETPQPPDSSEASCTVCDHTPDPQALGGSPKMYYPLSTINLRINIINISSV